MATKKKAKKKTIDDVKQLTPEQEALIHPFRKEWLAKCSVPGVDKELAEDAIGRFYKAQNVPMPPIVYVRSPVEAVELIMEMKKCSKVDAQNEPHMWGHADGYWVAFYIFVRDVLGVEYSESESEELDRWRDIVLSCGWWWPFDEICIVSERPTVHWTDEERPLLHNATGPTMSFTDGSEMYCWRNMRVPKAWIMDPDSVDPSLAFTHENLELRRCLTEILGWDKILKSFKKKVIDVDDPDIGELFEVDLPPIQKGGQKRPSRFIKVLCGTGRTFVLRVPPETKTALEGNAWTYGLTPEEFRLEWRT